LRFGSSQGAGQASGLLHVVDLFEFADERVFGLQWIRATNTHPAHNDLIVRRRQMFRDGRLIAIERGLRADIRPERAPSA
jgi:hypothetical protein